VTILERRFGRDDRRSPSPSGRITPDTRVIIADLFDPISGDDHPCITRSARLDGRWLWSRQWCARPDALISSAGHRVQMGASDRRPGWPAGVDGSFAVVTRVVETPWTGGAIRDAARHRGAQSSAHAGLHGRDGPPWTGTGFLIPQRSRVQLPPPLIVSAGQDPFLSGRGPLRFWCCSKTCNGSKAPRGLAARRGRWGDTG
jgi:hypothetical protein